MPNTQLVLPMFNHFERAVRVLDHRGHIKSRTTIPSPPHSVEAQPCIGLLANTLDFNQAFK